MQTNASKVRQFTEESTGLPTPAARKMRLGEVMFLVTMLCEEAMELLAGSGDEGLVVTNPLEALLECAKKAKLPAKTDISDEVAVVANQTDALVDLMYFCYNASSKAGLDLDEAFAVVHEANMRKRFPDGQFHRNANGKVEKPPGWQEPDVKGLVAAWLKK
jgi:predicted HAD superfamily Cof-like phosphohydrolase